MTLIIAMAAFILVTTLFILDASKDQNLSSEVSTFLKPFFAETVAKIAADFELDFTIIDWGHPRQIWGLFSKKNYDKSLVDGGAPISWNRFLSKAMSG